MEHLKKRLNQLLEKKIELDNYLAKQLPKSILQEAIQGKLVPQIAEEGTAQELLEQIKTESVLARHSIWICCALILKEVIKILLCISGIKKYGPAEKSIEITRADIR